MKEVNAPEEFNMTPFNLVHPLYWIWSVPNCRVKTLDSRLTTKRKSSARFDVFVWGGFIQPDDYLHEQSGNDLHIKFIRSRFPSIIENTQDPNYGQPWAFEEDDEVKIKGDLERVSNG